MTIFSKIINCVCEIFLQAFNAIYKYFFQTDTDEKKNSYEFEADILYDKKQEEILENENDEPFEILSDSEINTP